MPSHRTLVVQIPCYNEAQSLPGTIAALPRSLPGVHRIIVLVIDDGSTDNTTDVAFRSGAHYVARHLRNRGLGVAFLTGIVTALALGADIIVNTDGDNQYPGHYLGDLIAPILADAADVVIGDRQLAANVHFSPVKRLLERLGSAVVGFLSATVALDAACGFRAYSRYAALRLQTYNSYSYTLETLIQAGRERMAIAHVPILTNASVRPSRLHSGIFSFLWHQGGAIIRSYLLYQPLRTFLTAGLPFLLVGAILIARFMFLYIRGESALGRYVQSLSIGGTAALFGLLLIFMGLLADAMRANRRIMQEILAHLRGEQTASLTAHPDYLGVRLTRASPYPDDTAEH